MRRADGRKIAHVRLAGFTSGAHGEVGAAVRRLLKEGAEGVVLDLRDNGGGLLERGGDGLLGLHPRRQDRHHQGPLAADAGLRGHRRRDRHRHPGRRCWSTTAARRRPRSSPARCRTATARRWSARARSARASSRRSSRCRTAARSTSRSASTSCPAAATSAAAASQRGAGVTPDVQAEDDPDTPQRRGAGRRTARGGVKHRTVRAPERAAAGPVVGVLAKRGRFWTVEPFFERGRRDERRPPARRAARATSCWRSRTAAAAGTGASCGGSGRPDVARDVLEALMLDRGLRRRFDPLVEREAREPVAAGGPAARPARAADVHDRPADRARLRRRDLRRGARRRPGARLGPHRRRRRARAAGLARRPRGVQARHLGLRARARGADAARGALQPGVLAGARTRTGWPSPSSWTSTAPRVRRSAFHRSIIRSDKRLTYPEVDDVFAGRRAPRSRGRSRWRRRGGWRRRCSRRAARGGARGRELGAGVRRSRARATSPRQVPSEQTESHRLIEHLMIAANEAVATLLETRKLPALYRVHERPEPARVERLAEPARVARTSRRRRSRRR